MKRTPYLRLCLTPMILFAMVFVLSCSREVAAPKYYFAFYGDPVRPSSRQTFFLAVQSSEPAFLAGNAQENLIEPFHWVLDYWDETETRFAPVGWELSPCPIDQGPLVVQVGGYIFTVEVDFSQIAGELGEKVGSGTIRCRIRLPLLAYDPETSKYVFRRMAVSDSFEIVTEAGALMDVRYDPKGNKEPGGLTIDDVPYLLGANIDYDSINRGMTLPQ